MNEARDRRLARNTPIGKRPSESRGHQVPPLSRNHRRPLGGEYNPPAAGVQAEFDQVGGAGLGNTGCDSRNGGCNV